MTRRERILLATLLVVAYLAISNMAYHDDVQHEAFTLRYYNDFSEQVKL